MKLRLTFPRLSFALPALLAALGLSLAVKVGCKVLAETAPHAAPAKAPRIAAVANSTERKGSAPEKESQGDEQPADSGSAALSIDIKPAVTVTSSGAAPSQGAAGSWARPPASGKLPELSMAECAQWSEDLRPPSLRHLSLVGAPRGPPSKTTA